MKYYLRILSFAKPYLGYAALNALFNTLMICFSLFGIGTLIPILDMIFGETISSTNPEVVSFSIENFKEYAYYQIGIWIDTVGKPTALAYICIIASTSILMKNVFNYLAMFFIAPLRTGVIHDLRVAVHKKCLDLPVSYFSDKRKGDLLTRLSSDVTEIEWTMLTSLQMIVKEPLNIILTLSILIYMSPTLSLFVILVMPVSGLLISTIGKSLKRSSSSAQNQLGNTMSIIEETLGGMRIIKAFNAEKKVHQKFTDSSSIFRRFSNRVIRKNDASSPISETLGFAIIIMVIWFGGKQVFAGEITGGSLIAFIAFFYMLTPSIKNLTKGIFNIQKGNASSERIIEVLDSYNPILEVEIPEKVERFPKR